MEPEQKRADRLLRVAMIGMMVLAGLAVVLIWQIVKHEGTPPPAAAADIGGAYTLTDQAGRTVSDHSYDGLYRLIYFGYTFCPDACPTELQIMGQAVDALGPLGDKVQPIFITVDPARDTPKQLAGYVTAFHPRMVGLTGTPEQIAAVAKEYKVYYAKADAKPGEPYLMNHSSFVYFMGPDGKFLALFPSDIDGDKLAAEMRKYMKS